MEAQACLLRRVDEDKVEKWKNKMTEYVWSEEKYTRYVEGRDVSYNGEGEEEGVSHLQQL